MWSENSIHIIGLPDANKGIHVCERIEWLWRLHFFFFLHLNSQIFYSSLRATEEGAKHDQWRVRPARARNRTSICWQFHDFDVRTLSRKPRNCLEGDSILHPLDCCNKCTHARNYKDAFCQEYNARERNRKGFIANEMRCIKGGWLVMKAKEHEFSNCVVVTFHKAGIMSERQRNFNLCNILFKMCIMLA